MGSTDILELSLRFRHRRTQKARLSETIDEDQPGSRTLDGISYLLQSCRGLLRLALPVRTWIEISAIHQSKHSLSLESKLCMAPTDSTCLGNKRRGFQPVSYTHLRAHETPEHLVCRL